MFPALQAMTRRGLLDVPVIGVAKPEWTIEQLRARAETASKRMAPSTPTPLPVCPPACPTSLATIRMPPRSTSCVRRWARRHIRCSTWRFRRACLAQSPRASRGSAWPPTRASLWRNRSAATSRPRRRSTRRSTSRFPKRPSIVSITSLGKSRCRICSTSGSPMRCSSRRGTPLTWRACRSPWPRRSASATAAVYMRASEPCEMCFRITCSRCSR